MEMSVHPALEDLPSWNSSTEVDRKAVHRGVSEVYVGFGFRSLCATPLRWSLILCWLFT
jgi:hypothetical protein